MASKAQKLIYTLQAVYEGDGEIKKLESDLAALSQIDAHKKLADGWQKTNEQFVAAKQKMRELRKELKQTGDAQVAKQFEAASREVKKLGTALDRQKKKLDDSREAISKVGLALGDLDGEYEKINASAKKHGQVMSAMRTLGVRSFSDIEGEIRGMQEAYRHLAESGTMSQRELSVYHQKMKANIADLRKETGGWTAQLGKLRTAWTAVAGLLAGGVAFGAMVKNVSQSEKELATMATTAGLSASELRKYGYAVESVNMTSEQLADISKDVKDKIGDYLETGGGEAADFFENVADKAGLAAEELIKLSGPEALIAVKKAMDDAGISVERQTFYLESFGNDASKLIPLLEKEGAQFKKLAARGAELTGSISKMDQQAVLDVNDSLHDMWTAFKTLGTELVAQFAPAITRVVDKITELITEFNNMGPAARKAIFDVGAFAALATVWKVAIQPAWEVVKFGIGVLRNFGGEAVQASSKAGVLSRAVGLLGNSFKAFAAFYGGLKFGQAIDEWEYLRDVVKANSAALAEVPNKLSAISKATGLPIKSMDELFELEKQGKVHFDELKNQWVAGAKDMSGAINSVADSTKNSTEKQKDLTKAALDDMRSKYEQYANEIKRLQDEIVGRERSAADELREMARSTMSETDAWEDRKAQADEYLQIAKEAAEAGENDKAVEYADKAKELYKQLNTEVKEGNNVVIDHKEALETAMEGVQGAVDVAGTALKQQQEVVNESMKALTDKTSFAEMTKNMDDAMRTWIGNWQQMRSNTMQELDAVEQRIEKVVKDRETNVYVNVIEKKQSGGLAGALRFADGGSPSQVFRRLASPLISRGSGTRDDVPALLMRREYVQPQRAVDYYGVPFMEAIRRLQFPRDIIKNFRFGGIVDALPKLPAPQMMATGGLAVAGAGSVIRHEHVIRAGNAAATVYTDDLNADRLLAVLKRAGDFAS